MTWGNPNIQLSPGVEYQVQSYYNDSVPDMGVMGILISWQYIEEPPKNNEPYTTITRGIAATPQRNNYILEHIPLVVSGIAFGGFLIGAITVVAVVGGLRVIKARRDRKRENQSIDYTRVAREEEL